MKRLMAMLTLLLLALGTSPARAQQGNAPSWHVDTGDVVLLDDDGPDGDRNDPGYTLYREGYNQILEESWQKARSTFGELLKKFTKSKYRDDAQYWSAYALMHIDLQKARAAYQKFIETHSGSALYDDAVADLNSIQLQLANVPGATGVATPAPSAAPHAPVEVSAGTPLPPHSGSSFQISMRHLGRNLRNLQFTLPRWRFGEARAAAFDRGMVGAGFPFTGRDSMTPRLQIRLAALDALGDSKDDEGAFQTLSELALDQHEPAVLRAEALGRLAEFEKFDVERVCLAAARNDTNPEVQAMAITCLRTATKDKGLAIEKLSSLFSSLPASRNEQRATILFEVADVGGEKAVDLLARVAKADQDYELRSDAIYYLGSIGGEHARKALQDILKGE